MASNNNDSNLTAEHLLAQYEITDRDLDLIRECGQALSSGADTYVEQFYSWLRLQSEFDEFFTSENQLNRVQDLQRAYWITFFGANVNAKYVEGRTRVGNTHARIGLSLTAYFASMNRSLKVIVDMLGDIGLDSERYFEASKAVTKLIHLDTAVVVAAFNNRTNQIIAEQHEALLEMSTPVTEIWSDTLLLPIVGIIDSKRAQEVMSAVLGKIAETHARNLILDISGVGIVDTAVANHLIKVTKAARLMGCGCTISGLSPAIAQTMVELGVEVDDIRTTSTLKDALEIAFQEGGFRIVTSRTD